METLVLYLLYILAIIAVISVLAFANIKIKILNLRSDVLKFLIENDYETDKIDLNEFIK